MAHLSDTIEQHFRLEKPVRDGLIRLKLKTLEDLLRYFPARYADAAEFRSISSITAEEQVTVYGILKRMETKKTHQTKTPMTEGIIEDPSGTLRAVWFNQPYIAKMYPAGTTVSLSGKVSRQRSGLTLANPSINKVKILPIDSHDSIFGQDAKGALQPVYGETKGISSNWIEHTVKKTLRLLNEFPEYLPENILNQYSLPTLKSAFIWIHQPKMRADALVARKRFSFEEIFFLQLARLQERELLKKNISYAITIDQKALKQFTDRFPFPLTKGQERAILQIGSDLEKTVPMSRLLEGDVGSGKTAVAAAAAYVTVTNRPSVAGKRQTYGNLQVAYMAPTEILATQHFESFINYFKGSGISIALITGSGCRKFPSKVASAATPWTAISRAQLAKWIANGEIPMVIGTHALIQKSLKFKHLALAIIDEQHRFGLNQRKAIAKKDEHFPHLLSMTATPIPRTLALTMYGDLDLSLLDEMPLGRKPVATEIVIPENRNQIYERIQQELQSGRQLYVICPRIAEADPETAVKLQVKSVTEEARRLKEHVFPEYDIGILHSKMTKQKKESVMRAFHEGTIAILVATSVVEVGVNVPNATLMIIEGAERFGLAQLHQLRGRIARSNLQAYCYLFADIKTEKTIERLRLFTQAKNGFELAEYDLELRGTGELTGLKQWGITDIGMDAIKNLKLVEAARLEAQKIVSEDVALDSYPLLKEKAGMLAQVHFE